jgi:lipopolysaccharide export LptBFGC system permease protein LptF
LNSSALKGHGGGKERKRLRFWRRIRFAFSFLFSLALFLRAMVALILLRSVRVIMEALGVVLIGVRYVLVLLSMSWDVGKQEKCCI